MMTLSCLCGDVEIKLEKRPAFINECNCRLCSRTGARWGYYHPSDVTVGGGTSAFSRKDKGDPNAEVHFCPACGSTTHFVLTASAISRFGENSVMGVNMWLAEPYELAGLELRYPDGAKWTGEGEFTYLREPRIIS